MSFGCFTFSVFLHPSTRGRVYLLTRLPNTCLMSSFPKLRVTWFLFVLRHLLAYFRIQWKSFTPEIGSWFYFHYFYIVCDSNFVNITCLVYITLFEVKNRINHSPIIWDWLCNETKWPRRDRKQYVYSVYDLPILNQMNESAIWFVYWK